MAYHRNHKIEKSPNRLFKYTDSKKMYVADIRLEPEYIELENKLSNLQEEHEELNMTFNKMNSALKSDVITDEYGYIESINLFNRAYTIHIPDDIYNSCYKIVNNKLILDNEKLISLNTVL